MKGERAKSNSQVLFFESGVDVINVILGVTGAGGGDSEAVQPKKGSGVENCLKMPQNPQRQVRAVLGNLHG